MSNTLHAQNARQILLQALSAEYGVRVHVQSTDAMITPALRARQILYRFKKEDSDFDELSIRLDPDDPNNRLWIIRGRFVADPEPEPEGRTNRQRPSPIDVEL